MRKLNMNIVNNDPLSMTDLYNSKSDEAAVMKYITGSVVRGAVMNRLAAKRMLSGDVKKAFFDGRICFTNAYPRLTDSDGKQYDTIPTPKGFYENRDQSGPISHAFADVRDAQMKRAKVGDFAVLDGDQGILRYVSPLEGETFKTRLARNDVQKTKGKATQALFRGAYLERNQVFTGSVIFSDACAEDICKMVEEELNIPGLQFGGMRSAGHGGVTVNTEWEQETDEQHLDLLLAQEPDQDGYYSFDLLCLSSLCMTNQFGEPCGLNEEELANKLGLSDAGLESVNYATSITHHCSFNRIAGGRSAEIPVFEGGSMFRFRAKELPTKDALAAIEASGLGLMTCEGFGRVRFLIGIEQYKLKVKCGPAVISEEVPKELKECEQYQNDVANMTAVCAKAILRMKMKDGITDYILNKGDKVKMSNEANSQRGMISLLCKNYRYNPEIALEKFFEYIDHAEDKDARTRVYRAKVRSRSALLNEVRDILTKPLQELITLERDRICGIQVSELITEKEEIGYKLELISEFMSYINRVGKEQKHGK